jgi:hypothetical protein
MGVRWGDNIKAVLEKRTRGHRVNHLTHDRDEVRQVGFRALKFKLYTERGKSRLSVDCLSNQDYDLSSCLVSYLVEYG